MLHPSTKKLIDRLAEMTERGKLTWTESDAGVVYATEGYSVLLTAETNDLVITSKDGKELERASAEELNATTTETGGTYAGIVAAMTKEATRVARGTETAISSLLADLDQDSEAEAAPVAVEDMSEEEAVEDVVDDTQIVAADEVPEADSEPDVKEAVARMANEVNSRTEAAPVAEVGIAAAAIGTAILATDDEESEPEAKAPANVEAVAVPVADTDHQYVPFGLGETTEAEPETGFVPISDTGILEDTVTEAAPAVEAEETVPETTEETTEAPVPNGLDVMAGPAGDIIDDLAEPVFETSAEPDFSDQIEITATEAVETVEAAAPVEPEAAPAAIEVETEIAPQSFSLSGIGAGFGLGALTATTEASGIPSGTLAPEQEKIIIDATDDVPFTHPAPVEEPVTTSGLPDVASLEQPVAEPAQPEPEAVEEIAEPEEAPALKPRTRFNPWS